MHKSHNIRKFRIDDAKDVYEIIRDNFINIDLGGHTSEGIRLQIEGNSPINLIERSKKINYYVITFKEKIIGICGFDKEKIHTFFIHINYHKKGFGALLLKAILLRAKGEGIKTISTWSTIYAEKFYESFGFKRLKEITLPEGKEDIILIEMKKIL